MKKTLLSLTALGLFASGLAHAAPILEWSAFAGNSGGSPSPNPTETASTVDVGLASSSATLSRGAGFNPTGDAAYGWNPSNLVTAQLGAWGTDLAFAQTNNIYAEATLTPTAGNAISLSSVSFLAMSGLSSTNGQLLYSLDAFATPGISVGSFTGTGGGGTFNTISVGAVSALQNQTSAITFRWYFYGANAWDIAGLGGSVGNANPAISFDGTVAPPVVVTSVATPVIQPVGGTYVGPQSVSIATATSGATIYYTTNGSTPTISSTVYTAPFTVSTTGTTVKAFAVKSGLTDSAVAEQTYTITAAAPTFSVAGGTYSTSQNVALSTTTAGGTIYYTLDGSTPDNTSTLYSGPIPLTSGVTTISAITYAAGVDPSSVSAAIYTFVVQAPVMNPVGDTYPVAQNVTITANPGDATIYYTTDGVTEPDDVVGTLYTGPIAVTATTTIKAIAYKTDFTTSPVTTEVYTIATLPPGVNYASSASDYTVSSSDLLHGNTPVVVGTGSLWTGNQSWNQMSADATVVNDGSFTGRASVGGHPAGVDRANTGNAGGLDLIWNFATPQDLTSIVLYFSWLDGGRDNVPVMNIYASTSEYVLTDGPNPDGQMSTGAVDAGVLANGGFELLATTVDTAPAIGRNSKVTVVPTGTYLKTGVRSLYIQFGAAENGFVGLNEIDAFGVPSGATPVVADPVFTPAGGSYSAAQSVTITSATAGASIRYTTDGSTPTSTTGTLYTGAINVAASQTLKAIAYMAASTDSAVVSASYVINNYDAWASANGVTGGPNGDSDNDGVKNLVEYALANGAERGTFNATTKNLSFTKRGAPYGSDISYFIEESTDLTNWTVVTPLVNDATTISYTLSGGTKKFARLKVTQP